MRLAKETPYDLIRGGATIKQVVAHQHDLETRGYTMYGYHEWEHIYGHHKPSTKRHVRTSTEVAPIDLAKATGIYDLEALQDAVNKLPSSFGQAVRFRFYKSMGFAEIARRLGIADSSARSYINQGIRLLAKEGKH